MPGIVTNLTAEKYQSGWKIQSEYYENNEYYNWMSSKIQHVSNIIEIGSGIGLATVELAKQKHKIICIEINAHCAEVTLETLIKNEISAVLVSSIPQAVDEFLKGITPVVNMNMLAITQEDWNLLIKKANINCAIYWLGGACHDDAGSNEFEDLRLYRMKIEKQVEDMFEKSFTTAGSQLSIVYRSLCKKKDLNPEQGLNHNGQTFYSIECTPLLEGIAVKSSQQKKEDDVYCLVSRNTTK
jgi:hypothetical protein